MLVIAVFSMLWLAPNNQQLNEYSEYEMLMDEAAKYYANILWPYSKLVINKIEEIQKLNLKINIIAPSHGVIWRSNQKKSLNHILTGRTGRLEIKSL